MARWAKGFSFRNFSTTRPRDPLPGDRLDDELASGRKAVEDISKELADIRRSDGKLQNHIVTEDALAPALLEEIKQDFQSQIEPLLVQAQGVAATARVMERSALQDADRAFAAASRAEAAAQLLETNSNSVLQEVLRVQEDYRDVENNVQAIQIGVSNSANTAQGAANKASAYAELSAAWAEHMPDTIPPNLLAEMKVTGDHWSARWWASKAAAGFGQLTEFYLGVHATPPLINSVGDPIPTGGVYYDSTRLRPYIWNGSQWTEFLSPSKAYTATLSYEVPAGQTQSEFILSAVDLRGNSYTLDANDPEGIELYVNGVRILQGGAAFGGDYVVDPQTNKITLSQPLPSGTLVTIDVLAQQSKLAPGGVLMHRLQDFDLDPITLQPGQKDGVRDQFPLIRSDNGNAAVLGQPEELLVWVDGTIQRAGIDYQITGSRITFNTPPARDSETFAIWMEPGGSGAGGVHPPQPPLDATLDLLTWTPGQGTIWVDGRGSPRLVKDAAARLALRDPEDITVGSLVIQQDTLDLWLYQMDTPPTPPAGGWPGGVAPAPTYHWENYIPHHSNPDHRQRMVYDPVRTLGDRINWVDDRGTTQIVAAKADLNDRTVLPLEHLIAGKLVFVQSEGILYQLIADPASMSNTDNDWRPLISGVTYVAREGDLPDPNNAAFTGTPPVDGQMFVIRMEFGGPDLYRVAIWDSRLPGAPAQPPYTVTPTAPYLAGSVGDDASIGDFFANAKHGEWTVVGQDFTVGAIGTPLDGIFLTAGTTILLNDLTDPVNGIKVDFPWMAGGTGSVVVNPGGPANFFGATASYAGPNNDGYFNNPNPAGEYWIVTGPNPSLPVTAGNIAGQSVAIGDFIVCDGNGLYTILPVGSVDNTAIRTAYAAGGGTVPIGGAAVMPPVPPVAWNIPGVPAGAAGGYRFPHPENFIKALKSAPDQMTDAKRGDLQITTEASHVELKIFDGQVWLDVLTEDTIKGWIAALSLFEGTAQQMAGTTIGAVEIDTLPDLPALSLASDLSKTSHYWTWTGTPNYVIQANDPMIGPDLAGAILSVGDWLQIANRGGDGTGLPGPGHGPVDLHWVHIGGDLLAKSRGDRLYGLNPWVQGNWESGSLVVHGGDVWRATRGVVNVDPQPGPGPQTPITPVLPPATQAAGWTPLPGAPAHGDIIRYTAGFTVPPADLVFPNEVIAAGDWMIFSGDPTLKGTTVSGWNVADGWLHIPAADAAAITGPFNMQMAGGPWVQVPISGGLRTVPNDGALPPTANAGDAYLVIQSARNGGKQTIYGFDPAANAWVQIGGGGVPLNMSATKKIYNIGAPIASIFDFAGKTLPDGYLLCNGAFFNALQYPELFAALGVNRVPNLIDQFVMGGDFAHVHVGARNVNTRAKLGDASNPTEVRTLLDKKWNTNIQPGDYFRINGTFAFNNYAPDEAAISTLGTLTNNWVMFWAGWDLGGWRYVTHNANSPPPNQFISAHSFGQYPDTTRMPRYAPWQATITGNHNHGWTGKQGIGWPDGADDHTSAGLDHSYPRVSQVLNAGDHSHTIYGGDPFTMPRHIILAKIIKAEDRFARLVP